MNLLLMVTIAYLTINLIGGIFEVIRFKNNISKIIKQETDKLALEYKPETFEYELLYRVFCLVAIATSLLIYVFVWAPIKVSSPARE